MAKIIAHIAKIVVCLTLSLFVLGCSSVTKQTSLTGLVDNQLKACPDRPSCVCSTDDRERHAIAPLAIPDAHKTAPLAGLAAVVQAMPRTHILEQSDAYLHATFTSRLFRFVDDVEFLLDGDVVHVRSVSRKGYSDLGVNRKRVEAIRAAFK